MPEKTCNNEMKDISDKLIQDKNPNQAGDIKCAEIKSIPSVMNGFHGEKQKFKIGGYNRATASFEINSPDDEKDLKSLGFKETKSNPKPEFDLSSEITPGHYFKSSFARSMVVNNNASKSKSLDYMFLNRNGYSIKEETAPPVENNTKGNNGNGEMFWQVPGKENWDLRRAQPADICDDEPTNGSLLSDKQNNIKKSEIIEEHLKHQQLLLDRPGSRASSTYQRSLSGFSDRRYEDVLLRSPLTASCRSSYNRPNSSASDVDAVMLQSQVTTLQWQLRQAEASRQMHRAVLEQVVTFLEKTHRNLDLLQSKMADCDVSSVTRVPRSRSVHAVDTSPTRSSRSESNLSFHKAKSFAQIGDPDCPKHGNAYREMTWRRARKQQHDADEITPNKLSEEAFRLLRTVQSLLNTREPDLSSRLSNGIGAVCSSPQNPAEISSASSTVSAALDSDNSDNFQSQETLRNRTPIPPNSDKDVSLQSAFGGECSPIPGLSAAHLRDATMSLGRRRRYRTTDRNSFSDAKNSPPQLSISSADDESGFSSLNSFQEIGVPVSAYNNNSNNNNHHHHHHHHQQKSFSQDSSRTGKNNCQIIPEDHKGENGNLEEIGLPRVEENNCKIHRRWSSTPVDNHIGKIRPPSLCTNGDVIRVLWV